MQHANFTQNFPNLTLLGHTPLFLCMSPKIFMTCLKVLCKCHLYYLSQLITPSGTHLISWTAYWTAYIAHLIDKRSHSLPHKWYLDIKATTTIPNSHDRLYDCYVCFPSTPPAIDLVPGVTTTPKNRHWLVTLDENDAPLFGKQLSVQPKKDICIIVHWISDCLSSPGDVICLHPCLGCDAHVSFPSANKYAAITPRCTFKISLLKSLILPTNCERIRQNTTEVVSSYSWADLCDTVILYYRRLNISPDFSLSPFSDSIDDGNSFRSPPLCDLTSLPSPVILPSGSHYRFYTDGSLINLGSPEVSMGWSWVQIIHDAGYLNSVATYAHGTIRNWPSSTRAEAAPIYAALSVSLADSTISIYTDSQAAIDGLRLCASSAYTNSHLYCKTTNFELWASIEHFIHAKRFMIYPVKVKGHDENYWNEFADSLTSSAHHSDDAFLLPVADYTSMHHIRLTYDDVVCESNPRRFLKLYYQATFMKDLLSLKRFQFTFYLCNRNDYVIDWKLTWFTLNFSPVHDASFQAHHASRHFTFKFKLFLDELPLLKRLKITRPDLYIDLLTCHSCCDRKEDLMHLILCSKCRLAMHQILQIYQNHLFFKLRKAGKLADTDPIPILRQLSSLSCWTIFSAN
ncbi:ribonuclease H-like domain-containing protein [Rhizophagus clarus]|nr:ribonuclease H-like domain-containing protein [Rhizophagus clarus]